MAHEEGDSAETEERNPNSRIAWMARAQRADAELSALRSRVAVLEAALREIEDAHLPDQAASSAGSDLTWAMQHIGKLRRIARQARAALTKEPTP